MLPRLPNHRRLDMHLTIALPIVFPSLIRQYSDALRCNSHCNMAGKEATVYLLDLGKSMGEKRHGRDQNDLDWALEYVWDKITNTVSRRSFGDLVRAFARGLF